MEDNILEVKKLKISFRTNNGTVKAVRDISFDLHRGETLAIVGESGSGKSVTSRAVLGISAGNSIMDGGEILFDGKDLLKVGEEDMCKIRGDKISMIFQDPLSSLDPIVKIGQQIIEALVLKNRESRKNSRKEFNNMLAILKRNMIESSDVSKKAQINKIIKTFNDFNIEAIKLEESYNFSHARCEEIIASINDFLFKASKKQRLDIPAFIKIYLSKLEDIKDPYFTYGYKEELNKHKRILNEIKIKNRHKFSIKTGFKKVFKDVDLATRVPKEVNEELKEFNSVLEKMLTEAKPNFFRIGYYVYKNPNSKIVDKPIEEINDYCYSYLNEHFLNVFLDFEHNAIKNSYNKALEGKKKVVDNLETLRAFFQKGNLKKRSAGNEIKGVSSLVYESIDHLAIIKDSVAYTFATALKSNIKKYFYNESHNAKEEVRFARQTKKRDALIAKGKKIDWKVEPKKTVSLDDQIENIVSSIDRLEGKYKEDIAGKDNIDFAKMSISLIDYFKEKASGAVYKVTNVIARERAIKLMEEVGIPEPRIRYNQYPFEFSGGMRQRIVIAIALAANPDILICDEPTTALDVTIQSQILELIKKIKEERNLSVIFITHDLGVVANMADRIAVMYAGKIVEYGTSEEIFYSPAHPYTWALLSSMPDLDTKEKLEAIPGTPPNMIYPPVGDAFASRNKYALKIDFEKQPPLFKISETHYAATWLLHPNAPKIEMPKVILERINRMKERAGEDNGL
ncbi:MAG: ABC transporter ATP-binding protein [Bacillales bacterium]|nr:ABC transporter ATP-binding protein [Bacillales bacterium]